MQGNLVRFADPIQENSVAASKQLGNCLTFKDVLSATAQGSPQWADFDEKGGHEVSAIG